MNNFRKETVTGPIPAPDCTPGYADRDSLERQHQFPAVAQIRPLSRYVA